MEVNVDEFLLMSPMIESSCHVCLTDLNEIVSKIFLNEIFLLSEIFWAYLYHDDELRFFELNLNSHEQLPMKIQE